MTILALNAMIVYYGGNGMSEGLYLFTARCRMPVFPAMAPRNDLDFTGLFGDALGICYLAVTRLSVTIFPGGLVVS